MNNLPNNNQEENNGEKQNEQQEAGGMVSGMGDAMKMFQQMGLGDKQSAAMYLGEKLKESGIGQDNTEVMNKVVEQLKNIPEDMPMTQMQADQIASQQIQQGASGQKQKVMNIINEVYPYMMAMKMIDNMMNFGQQQNQRSDIEEKLLNKAVEDMTSGQSESQDRLDRIERQMEKIDRKFESGEIDRGTAIDQMEQKAQEINEQMDKFESAAEKMGYSPDNQSTLDKVQDISDQFKDIMGNLRESAPSKSQRPEKEGVSPASSGEKPQPKQQEEEKTMPEERTRVPISEEEEEEPETEPETGEESESTEVEETEPSESEETTEEEETESE